MKVKKIDIVKYFLFIIVLFPFIQQRTLEELPNFIQLGYKVMCLGCSTIIYLFILFSKKINYNKYTILFIIYWIFSIFNTVFFHNYHDSLFLLQNAYNFIALTLFLHKESKDNPKILIKSLSTIYHCFILINFVLFLLFPNGFYKPTLVPYHTGHLLGDDNALIYVILPGIIITCFSSLYSKKKLSVLNIFEIIACMVMFLKLWTVTSIVCFLIFIILILLYRFTNLINIKTLSVVLISFVLLLFLGLNIEFIQKIIVNVLHKSITLSGRTIIWKQAFDFIRNSLFLGYGGYFKYGTFVLNGKLYPCHTTYLQILIDCGLIGFTIFCWIIVYLFKELKKYEKEKHAMFIGIGFTCILINYLFEYSQIHHLIIIMAIISNLKYYSLLDKEEKNENRG